MCRYKRDTIVSRSKKLCLRFAPDRDDTEAVIYRFELRCILWEVSECIFVGYLFNGSLYEFREEQAIVYIGEAPVILQDFAELIVVLAAF